MLHNLAYHSPIPYHALELLRQRALFVVVLLRLPRHVDVHSRTLTREHLSPYALSGEVYRCAIYLVEHDRRQGAEDLHLEPRRLDHIDRRHKGVDNEGDLRRRVD